MCLQVCRREKYKQRKTKEGRPRLEEAVYCRLNCASLKPFADTLILFCKGHNSKSTRPTASWGLGLGMLSFEAGHAGANCAPAAGEDYCILLGLVSNVCTKMKTLTDTSSAHQRKPETQITATSRHLWLCYLFDTSFFTQSRRDRPLSLNLMWRFRLRIKHSQTSRADVKYFAHMDVHSGSLHQCRQC